MKTERIFFFVCIFFMSVGTVFASQQTWTGEKMWLRDDFGDLSEEYTAYTLVGLGTYTLSTGKDGMFLFQIVYADYSTPELGIVIAEEGQLADLSTAKSSNEKYELKIKDSRGTIKAFQGSLLQVSDYPDCFVSFSGVNLKSYFQENNSIKVLVSNKYGTYILETLYQAGFLDGFASANGIQRGPAGGFVFYDKGYYSDGWRYLEAAPADLRVINGVPTIDSTDDEYSNAEDGFTFGFCVQGGLYKDSGTLTGIGTGKANTQKLVSSIGQESAAFFRNLGYGVGDVEKTPYYAARLCEDLAYSFNGTTFDDWFLPSEDELYQMIQFFYENGLGEFEGMGSVWWSSSEDSDWSVGEYASAIAWSNFLGSPSYGTKHRTDYLRVRPIRAY